MCWMEKRELRKKMLEQANHEVNEWNWSVNGWKVVGTNSTEWQQNKEKIGKSSTSLPMINLLLNIDTKKKTNQRNHHQSLFASIICDHSYSLSFSVHPSPISPTPLLLLFSPLHPSIHPSIYRIPHSPFPSSVFILRLFHIFFLLPLSSLSDGVCWMGTSSRHMGCQGSTWSHHQWNGMVEWHVCTTSSDHPIVACLLVACWW